MGASLLLTVALLSAPPSVKALSGGAKAALGTLLDQSADPRAREAASRALVQLGEPGVAYALCDALSIEDESHHRTIRFVLQRIGAAELFVRELRAPDPQTRSMAATAAACAAGPETVASLIAALDDPEPRVRAHAADSLASLRAKRAAPTLVKTLFEDASPDARGAAAQALARLRVRCGDLDRAVETEVDPFAALLIRRAHDACAQ